MKTTILLIALIVSSALYSQEIDKQKLDELFDLIENNNQGIGEIEIAKEGKPVYKRAFGHSVLQNASSETNSVTKYRIGSITKMFTATMIHQLIDNKTLSPESKLFDYFPDMPNSDKITISSLLSHKSGLIDYAIKNDTLIFWLTEPVSLNDIYDEIKRQGVIFEPEDSMRYSNTGYFLLAKILEKVYGKDYEDILDEKICTPLNMKNTLSNKVDGFGIAPSYRFGTNRSWEEDKDFYFPNVKGVGDIASTPEDLNIFVHALFTNKIISKERLRDMLPVGISVFGKGLMRFVFHDKISYGHGGDTFGSHSVVMYNPQDSVSVAMSVNGQLLRSNDILKAALNIVYNIDSPLPEIITPPEFTLSPDSLDKYTGQYSLDNPPIRLRTFVDKGSLMLQISGQPALPIEATDIDSFRNTLVKAVINFDLENNTLTLKQRNMEFVFKKE